MNTIIVLDGTKIQLQSADLDGDGVTGGVERIQQSYDEGIQNVLQPTELGDTLKELNKDDLEDNTRMSGIDMRARLHPVEMSNLLALDSLVALQVMPTKCLAFSRQKKRLSVSHNGLGRREIVDIVQGKQERDIRKGGFMDNIKGFMGMGGGT